MWYGLEEEWEGEMMKLYYYIKTKKNNEKKGLLLRLKDSLIYGYNKKLLGISYYYVLITES